MCIRDRGYPEENPAYKIPCECRKPKTGMIREAAERYNIDLAGSWMIGDTTMDIQTGINAGMRTALVSVSYTHLDVYKRQRWKLLLRKQQRC